MIRGRRGQLPTILLFLVALALVGATLFVFLSFEGDFDTVSLEFSSLVNDAEFKYQYVLSEAELIGKEAKSKEQYVEIGAEREESKVEGSYNLFKKVRDEDFSFEFNDVEKRYTLSFDGLFVTSEKGESSITRNFDLVMEFDENGNVLKREISQAL